MTSQVERGLLNQRETRVAVAITQHLLLPSLEQPLRRVLADRLEQADSDRGTALLGHNQRPVNEQAEQVEDRDALEPDDPGTHPRPHRA